MSNSKYTSKLFSQVSRVRSDGSSISRLVSDVNESRVSQVSRGAGASRPGSSHAMTALSLGSFGPTSSGINFGKAPNGATKATSGSSSLQGLLKNLASGGVSNAFGGGLLSALGGIEGLVSGVAKLFGESKKAPQPLTKFRLAAPQQETGSITRNASGTQENRSAYSATSGHGEGIYAASQSRVPTASNVGAQSQQIAQAVKQALLTSSSLNDVIAEI